jgi:hypothetical protein
MHLFVISYEKHHNHLELAAYIITRLPSHLARLPAAGITPQI